LLKKASPQISAILFNFRLLRTSSRPQTAGDELCPWNPLDDSYLPGPLHQLYNTFYVAPALGISDGERIWVLLSATVVDKPAALSHRADRQPTETAGDLSPSALCKLYESTVVTSHAPAHLAPRRYCECAPQSLTRLRSSYFVTRRMPAFMLSEQSAALSTSYDALIIVCSLLGRRRREDCNNCLS